MENDKVLDIVLKRLDVLESKIDSNRKDIEVKVASINHDVSEINRKLWYFIGVWTVLGSILTIFGKRIIEFLSGV